LISISDLPAALGIIAAFVIIPFNYEEFFRYPLGIIAAFVIIPFNYEEFFRYPGREITVSKLDEKDLNYRCIIITPLFLQRRSQNL